VLVARARHIFSFFRDSVSVNVTGGEPLIFPGIFDFLFEISSFSNLAEMSLITNGTVGDEAIVRHLARLPRLAAIKISLESHDPAINDAIRGAGHFAAVMEHLSRFHAVGRPIVFMATLQRETVSSIAGLCKLARETGVAGIIFERYVPLGQGWDLARVVTAAEWRGVIDAVCAETGVEADWRELLPYRAFWVVTDPAVSPEDRLRGALCNLGPSSMALMPDGTVYPCRRFNLPIARIPDDPMEMVVERLAQYEPRRLSSQMQGSLCGACGFDDCVGCRALVRACGGTLYDDDPQCPLRLEVDKRRP